ncbi:GTPase Era [Bacteroidota bacterium]
MNTKSGFVSIIGLPNVGKSTLLNAMLKQKLSITTNKPQTTRKRVMGILSEENYQIIFLDTPGILNPEYLLQEKMVGFIEKSVKDSDIILFLLDISTDKEGSRTLKDEAVRQILFESKAKKILVINKIDLSQQNTVMHFISVIENSYKFDKIIPVSALKNFSITGLIDSIIDMLPEHPKYYPDDQLTDDPERFFVSEIIREKIFAYYQDEVPYSTEVVIDEFKEVEGRKDFISASIVVERDSQKPIIIGKGGDKIKKLGKIARTDIEDFLQRPVYLELRVKVRSKWRSNPNMLKNFGYNTGDE